MSKHPYPEHIRDKVALGLFAADCEDNPELDPNEEPHPGYYEYADTALQALWDASRVDTLDQLDELDHKIVVIDRTGHVADDYVSRHDIDHTDLPAHVIHWGDTDE